MKMENKQQKPEKIEADNESEGKVNKSTKYFEDELLFTQLLVSFRNGK